MQLRHCQTCQRRAERVREPLVQTVTKTWRFTWRVRAENSGFQWTTMDRKAVVKRLRPRAKNSPYSPQSRIYGLRVGVLGKLGNQDSNLD